MMSPTATDEDSVWFGLVWFGLVWFGFICFGSIVGLWRWVGDGDGDDGAEAM